MNEIFNATAKNKVKMPAFDESTLVVEHIVPPKKESIWEKDKVGLKDEVRKNVLAIGNMIITMDNTNGLSFNDKANIYGREPFTMTREITATGGWKVKDMEICNKAHAKMFTEIFALPKEWNRIRVRK